MGVGLQVVKRQHLLWCGRGRRCGNALAELIPRCQPPVGVVWNRTTKQQSLAQVRAVNKRKSAIISVVWFEGPPKLQVGELSIGTAVGSYHRLLLDVEDTALPQGAQERGVSARSLGDVDRTPHHLKQVGGARHVCEGLEGCLQVGGVDCLILRLGHLDPALPRNWAAKLQALADALAINEDEAAACLRAGLARALQLQRGEFSPDVVVVV
mmetsp:Transcript_66541/g.205972  ORF Transcript_66541/g.205972 Transcript_66541/m.205972 type:complete len:211 (-) Transcript_66541:529-1161(-)